jgi:hypothetical protein
MRRWWRARREAIGQRLELAEGTSAFANCSEHVAITNISRPNPLTPSALCTAPAPREAGGVKPLHSPVRDTRACATGISCFAYQTTKRRFLRYPPLTPALVLPRTPRLQAVYSLEIVHMKVSQCGKQMGTKF